MGGNPARDHGRAGIEQVGLGDGEFCAEEEHGHGHAEQQAAHAAVDEQEAVVGAGAEEIAGLGAELIAHGLKDEAEQYEHPQPIGAAEAGGVKQGEGGEEGSAEHH